ncbi:Nuclear GTPase SLIP-GC [Colletotrichum higginsianum]|uniref:Nuclear GTPase SLIP-GC n=1 Tax=Colletotrichum higginsianum TaxID=80884 RepID=A0A4T0VHN7_9PEZI|nr:Nuclear GTPase SLIP-GC [Colletotrichum higginsianum]
MVLGRTITLHDISSKGLWSQMQTYMGRNARHNVADGTNPWPLIKVVRVLTKASALSTGAVIVDLPGLHDSNAARAAVSTNYMEKCSGTWVVAPIIRAVDDKSAKDLMGESFRRRMILDGTYSSISFIGSKIDDINVEEAAGELDCSIDIEQDFARIDTLANEIPALETKLGELKKQNIIDKDALETCREEVDDWDSALGRIRSGQSINAATANLGKRKRTDGDMFDISPSMEVGIRLSEESQVEQHLCALKAQVQDLRNRVRVGHEAINSQEQNLGLRIREKTSLLEDMKISCIKKRNQASAQRIRQDFADGVREIDEATTPDQSDAFFNPDNPPRDYEKIKAGLRVFCISSRAYQKLNGMMPNVDFDTSGFGNSDDTGIPGLQAHAQKLTESYRNARCRDILVKLYALLASIACWVTGHDIERAGLDQKSISTHLSIEFKKFIKNLANSREACSKKLNEMLKDKVYGKTNALATAAARKATPYSDSWFESHEDGGLGFISPRTFRAVCRKKGMHTPRGRAVVNINEGLAKPIYDGLLRDWDSVFTLKIPFFLQELLSEFTQHQKNFHQIFAKKYQKIHHLTEGLKALDGLNVASRETLSNIVVKIKKNTDRCRSNAYQAVIQSIANDMDALYNRCVGIQGK